MPTLAQKANYILAKLMAVGVILTAIFIFFIFKFYQYAFFTVEYLLGKIHSACGCALPATLSGHHYIYLGLIFIFGAALLTPLFILIIKAMTIYRRTAKFVAQNAQSKKQFLSQKLNKIAVQLGLADKITEIDSINPVVFCSGFIQSRIYISSAIVESLSEDELTTVLLHEQHHLQAREPIKLFFVKIISGIFFFMPGVKSLARQYAVFSELAADEKATANFTRKGSLARALNKLILAWEKKMAAEKPLAVSFFSNTMEERINKLIDNNYSPAARHNTKMLLVGFLLIGIIYLLGGKAARAFSPISDSMDHGKCALSSAATSDCAAKNPWDKCATTKHVPVEKDPCAKQSYTNFRKK